MAERLNGFAAEVRIVTLPDHGKDVSDWLDAGGSAEELLALADAAESEALPGDDEAASSADDDESGRRPSTAAQIVKLALRRYRLGVSIEGLPFAVAIDGGQVVKVLRGGQKSLRGELASEYFATTGKVATTSAIADGVLCLEGQAAQATPEPVYLRVAQHDNSVVIDLGRIDGRVIVVDAEGWHLSDTSPVLFRRSILTSELSEPIRGGSLDALRDLVNVTDEAWPLLVTWLLASWLPDQPCPILLLGGPQGSGKTTIARLLAGLVDPSDAPTRSEPRDLVDWCVAASGSRVVVVDNVSRLSGWLSDCLCRAVTGDSLVRRQLYSDDGLSVVRVKRAVVLTTISIEALRGDLADRLLLVEVQPIADRSRRAEADLDKSYCERRPLIVGALLDVLVRVLAELPNVRTGRLPRTADFGRLLLAVDRVLGTRAFDAFGGQAENLAETVIDSDPVAVAVRDLIAKSGEFDGTPTEFYDKLTPERPPHGWPKSVEALSARLKRAATALEKAEGIVIHHNREGKDRTRRIVIHREDPENAVRPVRPVRRGPDDAENADLGGRTADRADADGPSADAGCPPESGPDGTENLDADAADAADALSDDVSVDGWKDFV